MGKYREYEMKITKMAGYLSDYYIDRAIESDDYSDISAFLISYFSGYDVGYLVSKYNEFGLNEKIEDIDFDMNEWYKAKYEADNNLKIEDDYIRKMSEDEYLQYIIEKRKKEIEE
jgi:hypothetical protein